MRKAKKHHPKITKKKSKGKHLNIIKYFHIPKKDVSIYVICILIILITLSIFNLSVVSASSKFSNITIKTTTTNQNLIYFWKSFLNSHPTYLPGWIELAKMELENGNIEIARLDYQKAVEINPNTNEVKVLEKEFNN